MPEGTEEVFFDSLCRQLRTVKHGNKIPAGGLHIVMIDRYLFLSGHLLSYGFGSAVLSLIPSEMKYVNLVQLRNDLKIFLCVSVEVQEEDETLLRCF